MPIAPPQELCQSSINAQEICPHALSNRSLGVSSKAYEVHFEPLAPKNLWRQMISFAKEICSRVSPSSLKSAWYIGTHTDLSQPILRSWKPGSYISEFSSPTGTVYVTADPTIMRAVFAYFRKTPTGLFSDYENKRVFIAGIVKDLYPEDIQEMGIEKAADMLIFSASTPYATALRSPLIKALGSSIIASYTADLNDIADGILKNLTEGEKKNCDALDISYEYTVSVISKLFLNYSSNREGYQVLAKTIHLLSDRMAAIASYKPIPVEEKKDYASALAEMRRVIEECLSSPSPYVQGLKDVGWSDFQIKINLFFLYFAAVETTASSMSYLILQLGKNNTLQQEIRDAENGQKVLLKVVAETLRLHPAAFIEGRQLREDTLVTIKDKSHHLLWKKELRKGHSIVCLPLGAGRDPNLYPQPEQFNPYRFQDDDSRISALLSFLPFGAGQHMCPGQHLALAELRTFAYRLLTHYSVCPLSPEKIDQQGFFILRASPARVQLTSRE